MAQSTEARIPPMYASYLTFTNLLDWLRELGTLPSQFDRSFWGHKFSGSGGAQLMAGLRFLGLLDGDKPRDELERLALASDDERQRLLAELLQGAYGADFMASLPRTTPRLVNEHLDELGTTTATHDKARSFLINAAKAAGFQMQPQVAKQARNRPSVTRKQSGKRSTNDRPKQEGNGDSPPPPPPPPQDAPKGIHHALVPLLNDLALLGPGWDAKTSARWKQTWDHTLDYAYPVNEGAQPGGA